VQLLHSCIAVASWSHLCRIAVTLLSLGVAARSFAKRMQLADSESIRIHEYHEFASGAANPLHAGEVKPQQRTLDDKPFTGLVKGCDLMIQPNLAAEH
jgi:hypothetical protein